MMEKKDTVKSKKRLSRTVAYKNTHRNDNHYPFIYLYELSSMFHAHSHKGCDGYKIKIQ